MKYSIDQNQFRRFTTRTIAIPVIGSLILSGIFVYIIFHLMSVSQWVNHSNKTISLAHELVHLAVDAETGMRGYKLTSDKAYLIPYENSKKIIDSKFDTLINSITNNPSQRANAIELKAAFKDWMVNFAEKSVHLVDQSKDVEKFMPAAVGKQKMEYFRSKFSRFIAIENNLRTQRSEQTNETVMLTLAIILAGSILGGVFLALFTKRQLTQLSDTYSKVIQKQLEQNQILEAQEWIQSGRTGLMDQIRGDHSLENISNNVLKFLCNRLDGKVGALYNLESNFLRRCGTYAFSENTGKGILKLGEGLVGQAALENKPLIISEIPEDYLNVSSSIGSARPNQIVILPLVTDNEVKGVIEIGFFDRISDRVIEYLTICSESIAIALRSAEYRTTLNTLLEESQRQTEELQAQQEELQANNEELEEQTTALKESQLKLENQQTELEQTNTQLSKQSLELEIQSEAVNLKNEELKKTQSGLEQKARELEQASQYKSQFLANMSHELRTPLNSTLILSQLLLEDKRNRLGAEEKEFAQTILSSSNDLLLLINDILDLSKVEAGKIELEPEEVRIDELLMTLERLFKPIANTKNIQFKTTSAKEVPATIFVDQQRLEQILKNLISNAVKFTDSGSVTVNISSQDKDSNKKIVIAVTDTGIGIAPEQQTFIFDAFKQADGTTSRRYGGTGLGLTISKDLAKLLGGDITVSSMPNQGSTFTLTLPERQGPEIKKEEPFRNYVEEKISTPPKVTPPPAPGKPLPFEDDRSRVDSKFKILLVIEDDNNFSKILYDLSKEMNFNCIVAQTAEEGIKSAIEFIPQAILLDMNLPDRSGLAVIDSLKMNSKTSHIPIHIISAQDQSNMALKMGAIGYLKKPVGIEDIKGAIAKMEEKLSHSLKRVLVVEDNKAQRESIKELIQNKLVEVVMAENASVAIDYLSRQTFDCMILDLNLPGMSGYELLEKMTGTETISHPPVIVYTGKDLSRIEENKLHKYSQSIILKGAHSPERLFSEVTLFLHQVENTLPKERQKMLATLRDREKLFEGKKILLVDDDVRNIFALSSALEGKGAIIETARNGKEAVDKVKKDPLIDLVLMDIMMPEMDGFEATREIRRDVRFSRLPIIAVTAKAMADDQEKCREAGANDYLAKPVDLTKLLSLLRVWMPQKW